MAATFGFRSKRFLLFLMYVFLSSYKSVGPSIQGKKQKIGFQEGQHGGYLGFPTGTILALFDLLIVLGFNDTSTLVGHFVSSPREREKREEIAEEMKERDREERGTGMKVKKQKK